MHEAMELIERHGADHVRPVLDLVDPEWGPVNEQLITALEQVTGEPVGERLRRYQPFADQAEGITHYEQRIAHARAEGDAAAELHAHLRRHELGPGLSPQVLTRLSRLMREVAGADVAFEPFDQAIEILVRHRQHAAAMALRHAAILEAILNDQASMVYEHADQLLAAHPDHPPALVVRMHRELSRADLDAAEATARRILDVQDSQAALYRLADQAVEQIEQLRGQVDVR